MRSLASLSILASLTVMAAASAQRPTSTPVCTTTNGPGIQRLQTLARQYHPDALTAVKTRAGVLIGFVLGWSVSCVAPHHRSAGCRED